MCEISSAARFFVHLLSDAPRLAAVGAAMEALRAEHGTQGAPVDAKKGRLVAALFDDGGEGGPAWFRARVDGRRKGDTPGALDLHDVTFVDYGNASAVTVREMRPLDPGVAAHPGLAKECALAFLRVSRALPRVAPSAAHTRPRFSPRRCLLPLQVPALGSDFGTDAAQLLSDLAFERPGAFRTHGRDATSGALLVSVWSEDTELCVNEVRHRQTRRPLSIPLSPSPTARPLPLQELLRPGFCRISRTEAKRVSRRAAASPQDKDVLLLKVRASSRWEERAHVC